MPAFRILNQNPVYWNLAGRLADGGSLKFYDSGTTTPRDVYGDQAKTVNNGSSVAIGSDGRAVHDIWGDGSYRVRLYDADGTLIAEADDVEIQGGGGSAIPALESGKFLSNDGGVMQWVDVREVPDPTGSANKVLGTDGTVLIWQTPPAPPAPPAAPDITVTSTSLSVGDGGPSKFLIQSGTATAPASGTVNTSATVTFPAAFETTLHVSVTLLSNSQPGGPVVTYMTSAPSTTGFTVGFDVAEGNSSAASVVNPVPFSWVAFGTVPQLPVAP